MPLLLLLLMVAGCASPGRELQRGTAVMPPPPPVRPGHGAPVVGQPGQQSPEVPRSPHHRALPPTREQGLWTGDTPKASRSPGTFPPVLLGVTLPYLSDDPTEAEEHPTRACAWMMSTVLSKVPERQRVESLTPPQQRCLAARLYDACAKDLVLLFEDARGRSAAYSDREHRLHVAVAEAAKRFERQACDEVLPSVVAQSILAAAREQWKREPWGKP